ncbi:MAG TPA: glycoside hydrolase domain-containing protein [Gemmatimonadales bacterium]
MSPSTSSPRPLRTPTATVALAITLVVAACSAPAPGPATAPVPAAATEYAAHPGFDTYYYPGDSALRAWRPPASPYRWVGFYLPAPCHRESSWSGKRQAITDLGYGIAVLYVGQQTWEGQELVAPADSAAGRADPSRTDSLRTDSLRADSTRANSTRVAPPACAPSQLTARRGASDAADAVGRAAAEGFAPGTVIYLNIERMETIPPAMHEYYRAWVRGVLADGRFLPGIYSHTRNADELYAAVRAETVAAGAGEPRFWIANRAGFDVTKHPADAGHPFAHVWQGAFDVTDTWGGVTLKVDANVARTPSPSVTSGSPGRR